jgi:hypothetical protein
MATIQQDNPDITYATASTPLIISAMSAPGILGTLIAVEKEPNNEGETSRHSTFVYSLTYGTPQWRINEN